MKRRGATARHEVNARRYNRIHATKMAQSRNADPNWRESCNGRDAADAACNRACPGNCPLGCPLCCTFCLFFAWRGGSAGVLLRPGGEVFGSILEQFQGTGRGFRFDSKIRDVASARPVVLIRFQVMCCCDVWTRLDYEGAGGKSVWV